MKRFYPPLAILSVMAICSACAPPRPREPASPCTPPIAPIRSQSLIAVINFNYTYTPKDADAGRTWHRDDVLKELNSLGAGDGNSFQEPNGQPHNFTFTYSIANDGQDHFTGDLRFAGWGQGHINTFYRHQYTYASSAVLVKDLTDSAYVFIRGGWHDARAECASRHF